MGILKTKTERQEPRTKGITRINGKTKTFLRGGAEEEDQKALTFDRINGINRIWGMYNGLHWCSIRG
jgi:hypothetical protein